MYTYIFVCFYKLQTTPLPKMVVKPLFWKFKKIQNDSYFNILVSRSETFKSKLLKSCLIINSKYWNICDKDYGNTEINTWIDYSFKPPPLLEIDKSSVLNESIFLMVQHWYEALNVSSLWVVFMKHSTQEFSNLCNNIDVLISISCSNSTVKRGLRLESYIKF